MTGTTNQPLTLDAILAGLEKTASAEVDNAPAAFAKTAPTGNIAEDLSKALTKTASTTTGDTSEMTPKQTGSAIAAGILNKLASDTNRVIEQTDFLVAEQDDDTELTPVDGLSVTEVAKALIARGAANGAVDPDALSLNATDFEDEADAEGEIYNTDSISMQPQVNVDSDLGDDLQKVAAVITLMDEEGYSFDESVELVKQAEEMIMSENYEQIKLASINALVAEGVDVVSAAIATQEAINHLEKQASKKEAIKTFVKDVGYKASRPLKDRAAGAADYAQIQVDRMKGELKGIKGKGSAAAKASKKSEIATAEKLESRARHVANNAGRYTAGIAGAGALGVGGAGYAATRGREKTAAALEGLIDAGHSVDDALALLGLA